jgi:hypothetical protein
MTDYTRTDFRTKKEVKQALLSGRLIACIRLQPNGDRPITDDEVNLSGPHYPRPHTWYANGECRDGYLLWIDGMTRAERERAAAAITESLLQVRDAVSRIR